LGDELPRPKGACRPSFRRAELLQQGLVNGDDHQGPNEGLAVEAKACLCLIHLRTDGGSRCSSFSRFRSVSDRRGSTLWGGWSAARLLMRGAWPLEAARWRASAYEVGGGWLLCVRMAVTEAGQQCLLMRVVA
ncbi:hypothetical protein E2562_031701, partial [Oryza meyeriana var. granulata]